MTALNELYREAVLEHNKNPKHYGVLENANHQATGRNPLCGDEVTVYFDIQDDVIQSVGWISTGCAVSKASTSIMIDTLKQKTVPNALTVITDFFSFMKESSNEVTKKDSVAVLEGVKEFPVRVKCALLGWKTAEAALTQKHETVTTESGE